MFLSQKVFIDSIANTVGTDFRTYKVVKRRQFTYVADTSRRGDRIGIALLETHDEGLVSPIYTVFEIIDHDTLLPEYLMMWFRRPEFDRYARFKSHGSVRELFDWEEMCDVELPMPAIEKQREIVKEYHNIVDRIKLNEQLNQKLEETAQAIYKQWFVDFEFPIPAEYAAAIGKPELEGQFYKSSGCAMDYNEVLKKEIPKGWKYVPISELQLDISDGNYSSKYPNSSDFLDFGIPFIRGSDFHNGTINPFNLLYISAKQHATLSKGHTKAGDILIATRGEIGTFCYITSKFIGSNINSQLVRLNGGKRFPSIFLGCLLTSEDYRQELSSSTTGSALQQLSRTNLNKTMLVLPDYRYIDKFNNNCSCIHQLFLSKSEEMYMLMSLLSTLLSKMAILG